MAATTRFVAAISTLSVLLLPAVQATSSSTLAYPTCKPTTTTVTVSVTVSATAQKATSVDAGKGNAPPSTLSSIPGVVFPTYTSKANPNGPYYNPYDYIPSPFAWPGKPTPGQSTVPPRPTPQWNYGGDMSFKYIPGCWVPKGSDLTPALPQSDTNGNSPWGMPDCPHLPPYLGPTGGSGSVSASTSAGPKKTSSGASGKGSSTKGPFKTSTTSLGFKTSTTSLSFSHKSSISASGASSKPSGSVSHGSSASSSGKFNATLTSSSSFKPTGASSSSSVGPFSNSTTATNGTSTNSTSAACGKMPDTGVTRQYDFTLSQVQIAPDGVQKNGLVINGGFPGPVSVRNSICLDFS
jgi:hypothetical protein